MIDGKMNVKRILSVHGFPAKFAFVFEHVREMNAFHVV